MPNVWETALSVMSDFFAHKGRCQLGNRCVKCSRLNRESNEAFVGALAVSKIRPKVILVVGHPQFRDEISQRVLTLTMEGFIVMDRLLYETDATTREDQIQYDAMYHRQMCQLNAMRVELADVIYVMNIDGTICQDTLREVTLAQSLNKEIRWWIEPTDPSLSILKPICPVCNKIMSLETKLTGREGWKSIDWTWLCVKCNPETPPEKKIVLAKG